MRLKSFKTCLLLTRSWAIKTNVGSTTNAEKNVLMNQKDSKGTTLLVEEYLEISSEADLGNNKSKLDQICRSKLKSRLRIFTRVKTWTWNTPGQQFVLIAGVLELTTQITLKHALNAKAKVLCWKRRDLGQVSFNNSKPLVISAVDRGKHTLRNAMCAILKRQSKLSMSLTYTSKKEPQTDSRSLSGMQLMSSLISELVKLYSKFNSCLILSSRDQATILKWTLR